ncbi:hypothetical protein ACOME3_007578 [Neoechinorhynchus agilis]
MVRASNQDPHDFNGRALKPASQLMIHPNSDTYEGLNVLPCHEYISIAIESSPQKRLLLREIYEWLFKYIPYYNRRNRPDQIKSWQNTVRYNLSVYKRFLRIPHPNQVHGSWWTVDRRRTGIRRYGRQRQYLMHNEYDELSQVDLAAIHTRFRGISSEEHHDWIQTGYRHTNETGLSRGASKVDTMTFNYADLMRDNPIYDSANYNPQANNYGNLCFVVEGSSLQENEEGLLSQPTLKDKSRQSIFQESRLYPLQSEYLAVKREPIDVSPEGQHLESSEQNNYHFHQSSVEHSIYERHDMRTQQRIDGTNFELLERKRKAENVSSDEQHLEEPPPKEYCARGRNIRPSTEKFNCITSVERAVQDNDTMFYYEHMNPESLAIKQEVTDADSTSPRSLSISAQAHIDRKRNSLSTLETQTNQELGEAFEYFGDYIGLKGAKRTKKEAQDSYRVNETHDSNLSNQQYVPRRRGRPPKYERRCGRYNEGFSPEYRDELNSIRRHAAPIFDPIDQNSNDKIITEQKRGVNCSHFENQYLGNSFPLDSTSCASTRTNPYFPKPGKLNHLSQCLNQNENGVRPRFGSYYRPHSTWNQSSEQISFPYTDSIGPFEQHCANNDSELWHTSVFPEVYPLVHGSGPGFAPANNSGGQQQAPFMTQHSYETGQAIQNDSNTYWTCNSQQFRSGFCPQRFVPTDNNICYEVDNIQTQLSKDLRFQNIQTNDSQIETWKSNFTNDQNAQVTTNSNDGIRNDEQLGQILDQM